jgi:hypothetical protein
MKKISSLLVVASVTALAALTGAADCLGNGSAVVECASAADCANETENTACDLSTEPGVCVAPTCAEDVDCQLSDTGTDSPIAAPPCDADTVEINGFVEGETYCAVEATADIPCADLGAVDAEATKADDGSAVTVCVAALSSCTDGVCGAN